MRLLQIIFFLLIICSCASNKSIEGVYGLDEHDGYVYYEFTLNKDSTFEYYWRVHLAEGMTKGTFTRSNNALTLNSEKKSENPIYVEEKTNHSDSINIIVKDTSNISVGFASVIINDSIVLNTDIKGKVKMYKDIKIKKIEIKYLSIPKLIYYTTNLNNNYFLVTINTEYKEDVYFENKKLKIRRNRLIDSKHKGFKIVFRKNK